VDVGLITEAFSRPLDRSTGTAGREHGRLQPGWLAQPEVAESGYEVTAAGRADAKAITVRASAEVEKYITVAKKGERGRGRTEVKSGSREGRKETKGR
jgi:hypothetical protein